MTCTTPVTISIQAPCDRVFVVIFVKTMYNKTITRELKNHDDDLVDDDRKWVTVYCASATSKFRRRGVVDDVKQSRITLCCNPQASAGTNPPF